MLLGAPGIATSNHQLNPQNAQSHGIRGSKRKRCEQGSGVSRGEIMTRVQLSGEKGAM